MNIKELPRHTVCSKFELRYPIWKDGRYAGLNRARITDHNEITFSYVRKSDGEKSVPDTLYFDGNKLNEIDFELQNIKNVTLVLVPFEELEILERV